MYLVYSNPTDMGNDSQFTYFGIFIVGSNCCSQKPLLYLTMAACMAGLGGILFGYDIGK